MKNPRTLPPCSLEFYHEILRRRREGETFQAIGDHYGCTKNVIHRRMTTWRDRLAREAAEATGAPKVIRAPPRVPTWDEKCFEPYEVTKARLKAKRERERQMENRA